MKKVKKEKEKIKEEKKEMQEELGINNIMNKYKLINRKNKVKGIVLKSSEELTLLINNPVDYLIDGLLIINNSKIVKESLIKNEDKDHIITHKFKDTGLGNDYQNLKYENFKDFFSSVKTYNLFCEFSLSKENVIYIGKIIDVKEDLINVDLYATNFHLLDKAYIKFKDITTIKVFTDYSLTFKKFHK